VNIGFGARRQIRDWKISSFALERILSRVASHKPEAVRELRRQNNERFRIEVDFGATLLDFCQEAGLSFETQKKVDNYFF
jgi:hypothetical protein